MSNKNSLKIYYSNYCEESRQLLKVFKSNPEVRQYFTLACLDKYLQKKQKYPSGIRGTPTLFHELEDEIQVFEGEAVFSFIRNIMKQLYQNDDSDDEYIQRGVEVTEDPGVSHDRYKGGTNRPDSWGKGTSINTIMPPEEWPDWAVNADGEYDNDPSIFIENTSGRNEPRGEDLIRRMKEMEKQRRAAEEQYKVAMKGPNRRGRPQPQQKQGKRGVKKRSMKDRQITV